jgi:hypothetical protein
MVLSQAKGKESSRTSPSSETKKRPPFDGIACNEEPPIEVIQICAELPKERKTSTLCFSHDLGNDPRLDQTFARNKGAERGGSLTTQPRKTRSQNRCSALAQVRRPGRGERAIAERRP